MSETAPDPVETAPADTDAPVETAPADPAPAPAPAPAPVADDPAPDPGTGTEPVSTGASNESPTLPPSAQAAAAKAHALLGHFKDAAVEVQAELERFVPAGMLQAAKDEIAALVRGIL